MPVELPSQLWQPEMSADIAPWGTKLPSFENHWTKGLKKKKEEKEEGKVEKEEKEKERSQEHL